jgi:hypothetical protein
MYIVRGTITSNILMATSLAKSYEKNVTELSPSPGAEWKVKASYILSTVLSDERF